MAPALSWSWLQHRGWYRQHITEACDFAQIGGVHSGPSFKLYISITLE